MGLDNKEERIEKALKEVEMYEYLQKDAYDLSFGQKQRVTIAGILSIRPKIIVMDEPTAYLDPEGKEDIKKIIKKLKTEGFTIVYITNIIDEIFVSDRVLVLEKGKTIKEFKTEYILENIEFLREHGLTIPKTLQIMKDLKGKGIEVDLKDLI